MLGWGIAGSSPSGLGPDGKKMGWAGEEVAHAGSTSGAREEKLLCSLPSTVMSAAARRMVTMAGALVSGTTSGEQGRADPAWVVAGTLDPAGRGAGDEIGGRRRDLH